MSTIWNTNHVKKFDERYSYTYYRTFLYGVQTSEQGKVSKYYTGGNLDIAGTFVGDGDVEFKFQVESEIRMSYNYGIDETLITRNLIHIAVEGTADLTSTKNWTTPSSAMYKEIMFKYMPSGLYIGNFGNGWVNPVTYSNHTNYNSGNIDFNLYIHAWTGNNNTINTWASGWSLNTLKSIKNNVQNGLLKVVVPDSAFKTWTQNQILNNISDTMPEISEVFTSTSETASRTFYICTTFSKDSTNSNVVNYVTTWGTSEATNTANQWSSKSMTFTTDNYTQYKTLLTEAANAEIEACKAFLDIPDVVLPANTSRTYTKNGMSFTLLVSHSKGNAINIVNTSSSIDGVTFGTTTSNTFKTQAAADTTLASLVETKIAAMQAACNNAPANSSATYTVGNMNYTLEERYSKTAGNRTAYMRIYMDGTQYTSQTRQVSSATMAADLSACATDSGNLLNSLKQILSASPTNTTETYTLGNMNFNIGVEYSKLADSTNATYVVKCDGVQYVTGSQTIDVNDPGSEITAFKAAAKNSSDALKTLLDGAIPRDSISAYTVNGFSYNVGNFYTKVAGATTATFGCLLDSSSYNSSTRNLLLSSLDNDCRELVTGATNFTNACKAILDTSPANTSYTYTKNGLSYKVGTTYSKTAGNTVATINTMLDGNVHDTKTQSIGVTNLTNNITSCGNIGTTGENDLKTILDNSPADYDQTPYVVDGFLYKIGAKFEKSINDPTVSVSIIVDGAIRDSYNDQVTAALTADDIASLIADARTAVEAMAATLRGIPSDVVPYTVNGFSFNLVAGYVKNQEQGTITIQGYIDENAYGQPTIVNFVIEDIDAYHAAGLQKIEDLKLVVASAPANNDTDLYTVNGFNFNIGTIYAKEAGSNNVNIFTRLDGKNVGSASVVTYSADNVAAISTRAASDLALLKSRLNNSPADYANTHTYSGFAWKVGVNFSKVEGQDKVRLVATLDNEEWGSSRQTDFILNDIEAIASLADTMENNLRNTLSEISPANTSETFTIRRFNFNIESVYNKAAGSKAVTTMVKLDGTQYDNYHQDEYDTSTASGLNAYNDALITSLKNRLTNLVPDDIHTTYSRNQFNFVIDAYFSKQANSDLIDIEYNIDSADLSSATNSTPLTRSLTKDDLDAWGEEVTASVMNRLKEFTYNANGEVAANMLGSHVSQIES